MWLLTSSFFIFQFLLRLAPGIMMDEIINQFNMDAAIFGMFSAVYYFAYAIFQIPLGFILDKARIERVVSICIIICLCGNMMLLYTSHIYLAFLSRFIIGFGSIAGFLGTAKIIKTYFTDKEYVRMIGLTYSLGFTGAICGSPLSILVEKYSWQTVLTNLTYIGIFLCVLILLFLRDNKSFRQEKITWDALKKNTTHIIQNKYIIGVGIAGGLMLGVMEGFSDIWGINFLQQVYGYSRPEAAFSISMVFLGLCIGGYLISYIADKYSMHYRLTIVCGVIMSIFLTIIILYKLPYFFVITLLLSIGILSCYQVLMFTIVSWNTSSNLGALTASIINMLNMSFGLFFHLIIGILVKNMQKKFSDPHIVYAISLSPILIGIILGTILFIISCKKLRSKLD